MNGFCVWTFVMDYFSQGFNKKQPQGGVLLREEPEVKLLAGRGT